MEITLEESGSKGRYVARGAGPGETVAELTFSRASPGLVILDHTGVPDALRGTGVGLALVAHAVEDARRRGFRLIPLCPFARAQFARHPEWADVVQD
jgi:predicted GNAT family acetyltransferase